jgi:hypothetical protein
MSRPSFRPRPLDIHQKLTIVRDPKEISAEEMAASRAVQDSHMALDKDNDEVRQGEICVLNAWSRSGFRTVEQARPVRR